MKHYLLSFENYEEFKRALVFLQKQNNGVFFEALSPYALKEISLPKKSHTKLSAVCLTGGLLVASSAFFLQWYLAAVSYPLNSGGKPLFSWPNFIPITFICGILGAALCAYTAFFLLVNLPEPYHPIFSGNNYDLNQERFYLYLAEPEKEMLQKIAFTSLHIEELAA